MDAQVIGSMAEVVFPQATWGMYGWKYATVSLLLNDEWQQHLDKCIAETHAAMSEIGLPMVRIPSMQEIEQMEKQEYTDEIHNNEWQCARWSALEFLRMAVRNRRSLRTPSPYCQDGWYGYGPLHDARNVHELCEAALKWTREANEKWEKTADEEGGWIED